MRIFLLILLILFPTIGLEKELCFVQLISSHNKGKIEKIFQSIQEEPATYLLRYRNIYTIRIGPFKKIKDCEEKRKQIKKKYKEFHMNPILVCQSTEHSPKHIVKIFRPQKTEKYYSQNQEKNKTNRDNSKRTINKKDEIKETLYIQRAKICISRKDCKNAIKYIKLAIKSNPKNPLLYVYLGYAFLNVKEYQKALESFKKALKINPKFAEGYAGIGYLYLKLNSPNTAAIAFKKAYEIDPNNLIYSTNYAIALFESGKLDEALKLFQSLKEKDPFLPEIYFNEALAFVKKGYYKEAYRDLEVFLEMTKANKYYKPYREESKKLLSLIENQIKSKENEKE